MILMAKSNTDNSLILIENLFKELLGDLPNDCAFLRLEAGDRATVIKMVPTDPKAAPITVIVPDDENADVTLVAGKGSYFEIPRTGRRYTNLPLLEELRAISRAVVNGKLHEEVTMDSGEVVSGIGHTEVPDPVTVRWRKLSFRAFGKTQTVRLRYEPYCTPSRSS
jgi:hypothetical protein